MTLRDVFEQANEEIIRSIHEELKQQGHYLTGALEQSVAGKIDEFGSVIRLTGTALSYSQILSAGVVAARIPYSPGSGAKSSKYITALTNYFILRKGLDEKEAKSAAFATAAKHKNEGMPTAGSYAFSKNGQRLDFIGAVRNSTSEGLDRTVLGGIDRVVDEVFHETQNERI